MIKCLIYEVKYSLCDATYIGKTHQTFKIIVDSHLSDVQFVLNNGQISYSFSANFEQQFKYTTSLTGLRMFMLSNLVIQLNQIGATEPFDKPNCILCM